MENQPAAIAPHLLDPIEISLGRHVHGVDRDIVELGVEIIPANAADDVEVLVQSDLIGPEYAETEGFAIRPSRNTLADSGEAVVRVGVSSVRLGNPGKGVVGSIQRLSGKLDPDNQRMQLSQGVKLGGEIRLIAENRLSQIPFGSISVEKPRRRSIEAGRYHFMIPIVVAKAQSVP